MDLLSSRISILHEVLMKNGLTTAPIVVLGMHRSGTTMIAKLLGEAGVFMGAALSSNHEPQVFQDANRQILDYFQAGWITPERVPDPTMLLNGFDGLCSGIAQRLIENIPMCFCDARQASTASWGFKDPRTSLTAGLFLRLLPNAKAIFIHRSGEDVAASVLKRELRIQKKYPSAADLTFEDPAGILLRAAKAWEVYNERALAILPHFRRHVTLRYEDVVVSPQSLLTQAFARVGVEVSCASIERTGISAERVGGGAEFASHFQSLREYLARSHLPGALERRDAARITCP
jgi:hypothetical protein